MNLSRFLISILLLLVLWPLQASSAQIVQAKLVSAQTSSAPGAISDIGVLLNIPQGWHIYGPRPSGETGLPTTVAWHLPSSILAAPINWPPVNDFIFQGVSGKGYTGTILLPSRFSVPIDSKPGEAIPIAAQAQWLACKEICVPESVDLFLNLPIGVALTDSPHAPLFEPSTGQLPVLESTTLWIAIVSALIGGLILNLMPCVFPILSMKAIGLIQKSQYENRRDVINGGLTYTAGVIMSFWLLAALLVVLRWAGVSVGWGVQLQSPWFILFLAMMLLIIGLMLSDIIRITGNVFSQFGDVLTHRPSFWGPFFTGVLAVAVATPCTAPFMGGAMFFALTQNAWVTFLVFTALGIGMAGPYLFLTLYPPALKLLPRPGEWMVTLKRFLAIPMYLAAAWLLWVFVQQADIIPHRVQKNSEPYSAQRLSDLRAENKPVFVNMTASWCITCLFNEKNALNRREVRDAFAQQGIVYLVGDWTDRDPEITQYLAKYRRVGVPLYVYYAPGKKPVVLPQILTPKAVIKAIKTNELSPQRNNSLAPAKAGVGSSGP